MKLKAMSAREQVLVGIVIAVLAGGGYGLLRYYPAHKALTQTNEAVAKTETRLHTAEIPELPEDDEDDLLKQMRETERSLAGLAGSIETVENRLAAADSQELRLRISDLARTAGVLVLNNKAYANLNPAAAQPQAAPRKSSRRARKAAAAQPAAPVDKAPAILPASAGWLARMAPGTAFHRPMQQIALEGDFDGIKQFIRELNRLPWQVTIVQMKLETKLADPPAGLPQRLSADFILAL